jgi:hypothetical protein
VKFYKIMFELFVALIFAVLCYLAIDAYLQIEKHKEGISLAELRLYIVTIILLMVPVGLFFAVKLFMPFKFKFLVAAQRYYVSAQVRKNYYVLARGWGKYVTKGNFLSSWRIRRAVAQEYRQQEEDDLSGHGDLMNRGYSNEDLDRYYNTGQPREGRPLIITNFIRYSKLVEAVVRAALATRTNVDHTVLCITTLNMSLEKWFNFDETSHCIHSQWDQYLRFLERLVGRDNVILARILMVRPDDKPSNNRINLKTRDELTTDLNSWIWLAKRHFAGNHDERLPFDLRPLTPEERSQIFGHISSIYADNASINERQNLYSDPDRSAYLILPGNTFDVPPEETYRGKFVRLGKVFADKFHTNMQGSDDSHAYYSLVDPEIFIPKFDTPNPPPPSDLFYVALIHSEPATRAESIGTEQMTLNALQENLEPLFCIAAKTDEALHHMAYLSLLDKTHSPKNFKLVTDYIDQLISGGQPLSTLMSPNIL